MKANWWDIPYAGQMRVKRGHMWGKKGKDKQREASGDIKLRTDNFD